MDNNEKVRLLVQSKRIAADYGVTKGRQKRAGNNAEEERMKNMVS